MEPRRPVTSLLPSDFKAHPIWRCVEAEAGGGPRADAVRCLQTTRRSFRSSYDFRRRGAMKVRIPVRTRWTDLR